MAYIVNLSSVHCLLPVLPNGIGAFAKLCNQHSHGYFSCCATLFNITNFSWVIKQYLANRELFNKYKLGTISTREFIDGMLAIFPFMKNVENGGQLLINAWNVIIEWDDAATARLDLLLSTGEPVYFISNTNELNLRKILDFFCSYFPDIPWRSPIDIENKSETYPQPIELAPNIFLCASYRYGLFKEGTPGLIEHLVKHIDDKKITVVSQFQKDLDYARNLGITHESAHAFYSKPKRASALTH